MAGKINESGTDSLGLRIVCVLERPCSSAAGLGLVFNPCLPCSSAAGLGLVFNPCSPCSSAAGFGLVFLVWCVHRVLLRQALSWFFSLACSPCSSVAGQRDGRVQVLYASG